MDIDSLFLAKKIIMTYKFPVLICFENYFFKINEDIVRQWRFDL
jgi:hypothetical protein